MANVKRLVLGGGGGRPDYLQKLKVPEGYEKRNEKSNIGRGTVDGLNFNCKGELHEDDVHRHLLCSSDRAGT